MLCCLSAEVGVQEGENVAQQYAQGIVESLVGGAPGTSIYGFGNNKGNGMLAGLGFTSSHLKPRLRR